MSPVEDAQLPPIATIADVVEALRLLGVGVAVDDSIPGVEVGLAYSAVGAAERNALATKQHARAGGAGPAEFGEQVGAVLDGAACRSDLEVLALLEWRTHPHHPSTAGPVRSQRRRGPLAPTSCASPCPVGRARP